MTDVLKFQSGDPRRPIAGSILLNGDYRLLGLIARGDLERRYNGWRYGTKRIADHVVERLINSGRAMRLGDRVCLAPRSTGQPHAITANRNPPMPPPTRPRLTDELTEAGLLVEAGWIGLRIAALPVDTPADQLAELRNAFFAGAHHLFASLMTILDPVDGVEPTEEELARITLINAELKAFITTYAATRLPTKGTA